MPTDFSENAFNAISYALNLYKKEECAFYLLNTFTPSAYHDKMEEFNPGQTDYKDANQESSLAQMAELQKHISKKFKNPKHLFIPHCAFNSLVAEIKKIIEKENIDIVIMGTQGATGAADILFGTNTIHIIKKSGCPILAVPSDFKYKVPKRILFPTDYEIVYQKEKLRGMMEITKQHRSQIDLLYVSGGQELNTGQLSRKASLEDILNGIPCQFHIDADSKIPDAITDFTFENNTDLLCSLPFIRTPQNSDEKRKNKEAMQMAENIFTIRKADIIKGKYNIKNEKKGEITFLDYFRRLKDERYESHSNYGNWDAALKHIERFCPEHIELNEIDTDFVKDFQKYLDMKAKTKSGTPLAQNSKYAYFNKFRAALREAYNENYNSTRCN